MTDDFNKEAMREKVRKNLENGFTLAGILEALKKEKIDHLTEMRRRELRVIELTDQIEFMEQEYGSR